MDYANAQDMIDGKIKAADAFVEDDGINKVKWPVNRRPQDGHKPEDVIQDVKKLCIKLRWVGGAGVLPAVPLP